MSDKFIRVPRSVAIIIRRAFLPQHKAGMLGYEPGVRNAVEIFINLVEPGDQNDEPETRNPGTDL